MLDANFWQNKLLAQKIIKEKKFQEDLINSFKHAENELNDLSELNNLAIEESNNSIIQESIKNIEALRVQSKKNETKCFLSKEND